MKRKLIIYNIFIVLVLLCTSVYAATTAKLNLVTTPENAQIKSGEKFVITLALKDFAKSVSVDTISGYIDIDENVVKDITIANIVKTSGNTVKVGKETLEVYDVTNIEGIPEKGIFLMKDPATDDNSEHDYKITIELSADNKISTEDIVKIEFETKDNLKENTYEDIIKFVGFEATSGWTESVSVENEEVSVIIKNAEENKDDGNKDDGNKDDGNKDDGNKDDGNKDDGNKDDGNKDDGNKDDGNKDDGNKDDGNKDDGNKDDGNKDDGNKDDGNKDDGNKDDGNKDNGNKNITDNKITNTNKNKVTTNTKDNTLANKNLPATGATSLIIKIIAVGLVLGLIVYVKYKKYKNI